MNKYGCNKFKIESLGEFNINDLSNKEIYFIKKFNTFHYGYNATLGGDGKILISESERIKIKLMLEQGYYCSEICRAFKRDGKTIISIAHSFGITPSKCQKKHQLLSKPIKMLNKKSGCEIKRFSCMKEACDFIKRDMSVGAHIRDVCNGKRASAYGYKWADAC